MMLLLGAFLLAARVHVDHCYVFDITVPIRNVSRRDLLEIDARVGGRIANHSRLRVEVMPAAATNALVTQRFAMEEPGSYIALLNVTSLPDGLYRVHVFFAPAPRYWLSPWFSDAHIQRTVAVRVHA